jgi:hypothetical protein
MKLDFFNMSARLLFTLLNCLHVGGGAVCYAVVSFADTLPRCRMHCSVGELPSDEVRRVTELIKNAINLIFFISRKCNVDA